MDGETAWLSTAAYFVALVNPASKVFLLSSWEPPLTAPQVRQVAIRSTAVALTILLVLAAAGRLILQRVFHVDLYSLNIAGGVILFLVGLNAVRQGRFHERMSAGSSLTDLSVVPLAAPLIAGPGTITAAISFATLHGFAATAGCIAAALGANLLLMLASLPVGRWLERIHATGPLIRIAGMIVAAMAVQMVLTGVADWARQIPAFSATPCP